MANSTYLSKVVEPFIVNWVSNRIRIPLRPARVCVGQRTDGTSVHFHFDGVSEDEKVGLLVSTSQTLKPGGTRKLHVDACILLRAPFERRIMAFVCQSVIKNFVNKCDGLLPLCQIEMLMCDSLPMDMQEQIARFQAESRSEMGDKGKLWKPGGQRR